MTWLYLIGLVITIAVLVYLVVALLKPEYFS
ncbi:MAG: K(+)-transporting ATPase subunit F [Gammaproteobacteria bacterium]